MPTTVITSDMLTAAGATGLAAFAEGKTVSEFATTMEAILVGALAQASLTGKGIVSYSLDGQAVQRSIAEVTKALDYFRSLKPSAGSLSICPIEFG